MSVDLKHAARRMTEESFKLERGYVNLDLDVSAVIAKLRRPQLIQASLDKPVRERTALDAAYCALARLIADGTFK